MIKKTFLLFSIFLIIMAVGWHISQIRSLSFHFVDEEDHITIGRYTNRGFNLYQDIQSNHQPLVYFGSALLQRTLKPENIFMLVRRHRQVMFFYGLLWSIIIFWRFRSVGLIFVAFFEFLKYWLLGNLWLMESFAVYPAVYLFGSLLENWINKVKLKTPEWLFLGLCSFLVIFNLVPLWPWLATIWLIFLIKNRLKVFWAAGSLAIITTIFFSATYSFSMWFKRTIYNNFVYAVPSLSPFHGIVDYLKMVFFPFLAFFTLNSLQAKFISFFFTAWLVCLIYLIIKKDRRAIKIGLIYLLLMLANNRILSPASVYYEGFHLLPWMGFLIFTFAFCLKTMEYKFWPVWLILAIILMSNKNVPIWWKTDPNYEYYVNYSPFDDFNFALKTINKSGQKLAISVLTNETLIQWRTLLDPATKQIVSYAWENLIPELKEDRDRVFSLDNPSPPEFIYGSLQEQLVETKYRPLYRYGKATELFIRKDIFDKISPDEWDSLETRGFEPTINEP